jgi:hypothetical protein
LPDVRPGDEGKQEVRPALKGGSDGLPGAGAPKAPGAVTSSGRPVEKSDFTPAPPKLGPPSPAATGTPFGARMEPVPADAARRVQLTGGEQLDVGPGAAPKGPTAPPTPDAPPKLAPTPVNPAPVAPPLAAPLPVRATPEAVTPPIAVSGAAPSRPPAGPPSRRVISYDETVYRCQANDNYIDLSKRFYETDAYAAALQLYNRNHPQATPSMARDGGLIIGEPVYVPSTSILHARYGAVIRNPSTPPAPTPH